jgi:methylated-DNA-[protein]-cysteine S-methyltransferase
VEQFGELTFWAFWENSMPSTLEAAHAACIAQHTITTPLGLMLLARSQHGLCGAWFEGQSHHPGPLQAPAKPADAVLRQAASELLDYFDGGTAKFSIALDPQGSDFQKQVWLALRSIARGNTCSYGDIARTINAPQAVRPVGAAIGKNPLSIIVPCHRVLGRNGSLTGYAGGLARKQALLTLELAQQTSP